MHRTGDRPPADLRSGNRPASARALLAGVIDYAGLFPPAARPMPEAAAEYAAALAGPDAWMLGRFVLPAARLGELGAARLATEGPDGTWRLSAIVRDRSEEDRSAIRAFNADEGVHRARVDTVECKPQTLEGIDWLAGTFGSALDVYVEVAAAEDAARWLDRVRARGLKGKVRTGGLTADAFPSPEALLSFIDAAVRLRVPFKATAGLHHAVRGSYRLTYEPGARHAPMYGCLNVLLATAARRAGLPLSEAGGLLQQADAASLVFTDDTVRWDGVTLSLEILRTLRHEHLVSLGSCSFREPVDELHALTA